MSGVVVSVCVRTKKRNTIYTAFIHPPHMALRAARALTWLPVAVAADAVLGGPARAAGGGMAPALADGDVVLVDRLAVRLFTYERGDVVQLR